MRELEHRIGAEAYRAQGRASSTSMGESVLQKVNLNLLVVFLVLMRERSATKAAKKLSLTQPAVSSSLKALRELFADNLFVRTAQGMAPTPVAFAIYEDLAPSLDALNLMLKNRMNNESYAAIKIQKGRFRR